MAQTNILLESGTNELEIVEFYVQEDDNVGNYGLNVAKVVEIIRMQKITSMPEMRHPAILGAFMHRNGRVVPLVDVAKYLDSAPINTDGECKIIVTEFNSIITGFLVSGVTRIYRLSWADVEGPGPLLQSLSRSAITGVVRLSERVIFLLDLEAIVADMCPEMAMHLDMSNREVAQEVKLRILHVDDSGSMRRLVFSLLEQEGRFEVMQAEDGKVAYDMLLDICEEAKEKNVPVTQIVQGIIADIEMPNMDGLALCKKIKEHAVLKDIPVAIFSSLVNDSIKKKCFTVGADAQFTKPDLQALSDNLLELILHGRTTGSKMHEE